MKITDSLVFIVMMLVSELAFANAVPIPEPEVMPLLLIGVASMGLVKWKKRKKD